MAKQDYKVISIDFLCDTTAVPNFLLRSYRDLGLNEKDLVFLLELMSIKKQAKSLTKAEVEKETAFTDEEILALTASLTEKGFLKINRKNEILLGSLYDKFKEAWGLEFFKQQTKNETESDVEGGKLATDKDFADLYSKFEVGMGRPLTMIEIDKIKDWFYTLKLPADLIYEALTRAVLMGKYNFAYINGILRDWQNQKLLTVEAVKAFDSERENGAKIPKKAIDKGKSTSEKINFRKDQTDNSFEDLYES